MTGFGKARKAKKASKARSSALKLDAQINRINREKIELGVKYFQQGELSRAKDLVEDATKTDTTNSFALGLLATIEKALGNKELALKLFRESIKIDQNNPDILNNYSDLLAESDIQEGIRISNKAVSLSPNNSQFLERNGYLKWKSGDLSGAVNATRKAIEIDPYREHALMNMGGIYKELGNFEEARMSTIKCIELNPNNADALINLSSIYKEIGSMEQALETILKALYIKPNDTFAIISLCNIHKALGNHEEALESIIGFLEHKPDNPEILLHLGIIYRDLGKLDEAVESTLKCIELNPNNPDALLNLGILYKDLGKLDEALESTVRCLEVNPDNPDTLLNLGSIYKDQEKFDQALESTLRSLDLNPDNPITYMNLGSIHQSLGNLGEALKYTLKSIEIDAENAVALLNLGSIYKNLGNADKALTPTLNSLAISPNNPNALLNLGTIYKDLGDFENSHICYDKALKIRPNHDSTIYNLSLLNLLCGNYEIGWKQYELRFQSKQVSAHAEPRCPQWNGIFPERPSPLVIVTEQGIGDSLQFMRYVQPMRELGFEITICAEPKLHGLIIESGIDSSPISSKEAQQITQGYWMPLISIPGYLKVSPKNYITNETYLKTSAVLKEKWSQLFAEQKKPIVGINWRGNRPDSVKKNRNIPTSLFREIVNNSTANFVSVQRDSKQQEIEDIFSSRGCLRVQAEISEIANSDTSRGFLEYASIIVNCDIIITNDTTLAHLAAGMGVNTWVLLEKTPEWFWGLSGKTSFWYPSARLYRQTHRNKWEDLMADIAKELEAITG